MSDHIISKSTLVPVSAISVVVAASFWISGLSKDVQAANAEIARIRIDRTSLEAEIISQMRSQAITMQEIQIKTASLDSKVAFLIKLQEKRRE